MTQRVFVKVMGFTDVERHALNTVFRLSEQGETVYSLWQEDAPEAPKLALVDGESYEAALVFDSHDDADLKLIWVGAAAPAQAWRVFPRPLSWPDVVNAMDELFQTQDVIDFDLDFDTAGPDTLPPEEPLNTPPAKRALIASASLDERLYLRAKLALAGLPYADEAETGAQVIELTQANPYAVVLVDFGLPDVDGWELLKTLKATPSVARVIMTKARVSPTEWLRARFGGAQACFNKPPHPGKLQHLLESI